MPSSRPSHRPSSLRSESGSSIDPIQEEVVSKDGQISEASAPLPTATETSPLLSSRRRPHQPHYLPAPSHESKPKSICNSILVLLGIFTFAVTISIVLQNFLGEFDPADPPATDPRGRRHPAILATGRKAGVATENEVCSRIGLDALLEGGTAVDAAVASTLCVGVLNMFSSGIGGGGFMIVRDPTPCSRKHSKDCVEHTTIDFRETAPAAANKTMYVGRVPKAQFGGLAVGVPGELRGLQEAHRRYGRLSWKRLVQPSVELAKSATVSKELARRLAWFGGFMFDDDAWSEIFVDEQTGELKKEGDTFSRPAYARTLQTIADHGADVFYRGKIAKSLVETTQARGGILTLQDLEEYKVVVKPALHGSWMGKKVYTTHAPTSGPILLSILNILSLIPDFTTDASSLNMHRFIEALKFGFGQRTELADPAFMSDADLERIAQIPTPEEAQRIFTNITDDKTHPLDYYHPKFDIVNDHGTMHLSILDSEGMAIALTSTVNLIFGSRVMDRETGVILNDEMDDTSTPGVPNAFGLAPSPYNYPEARKRPLSSTCPTIIESEHGDVELILGGSGGSRIFSSVLQTIFNFYFWGMDLSQAIEAPRLHHQLLPTQLSVETGYSNKTLAGLLGRGHDVSWIDIDLGIAEVQAVAVGGEGRRWKKVWAASDSRKGGVAVAI